MTKCIIIEDQAPAQRILQKYISDFKSITLMETFSNAMDALDYLQDNTVELIFLDIHLPQISGMDFLKRLDQSPVVILTTAFPDFALESYNLGVVDYLLKPFSFTRFLQAIDKANHVLQATEAKPELDISNYIFIKSGHEHIKINATKISYIKSDRDYTEIFIDDKKYLSTKSLKNWVEKLNEFSFLRIHKSYIINLSKMIKVVGNIVHLEKDLDIPIGRAFKEQLMSTIKENPST